MQHRRVLVPEIQSGAWWGGAPGVNLPPRSVGTPGPQGCSKQAPSGCFWRWPGRPCWGWQLARAPGGFGNAAGAATSTQTDFIILGRRGPFCP